MNRLTPRAIKATAHHEAGHAVMAFQLGVNVRGITIIPDHESAGSCLHEGLLKFQGKELVTSPTARIKMEKLILICLAGPLAQRKFKPRSVRRYHAGSDYSAVANVALSMNGSTEQANAYIRWLEIRVKEQLYTSMTWRFVEAVASELIKNKEINGKSLPSIFAKMIR